MTPLRPAHPPPPERVRDEERENRQAVDSMSVMRAARARCECGKCGVILVAAIAAVRLLAIPSAAPKSEALRRSRQGWRTRGVVTLSGGGGFLEHHSRRGLSPERAGAAVKGGALVPVLKCTYE